MSQSYPIESNDSLFRRGNTSENKGSVGHSFKSPRMIAVIVVLSGKFAWGPNCNHTWFWRWCAWSGLIYVCDAHDSDFKMSCLEVTVEGDI